MTETPPELLAALLSAPATPTKWTRDYAEEVVERLNRRIQTLEDRVAGVTSGRTMPSDRTVAIGSGRHLHLAILFLDISGFTSWPSATQTEQKRILWVMDVFMAEMMNIVRDHDGVFEKNTGDGLMAYFGTDTTSATEKVGAAVEAAVIMHYVNDRWLTPWFAREGIWPVRFRVGVDYGEVTIARIGIHGTNTFVAIGSPANIANRLLRQVPSGICIGQEVYTRLPTNWNSRCSPLPPESGYVYVASQLPYPSGN